MHYQEEIQPSSFPKKYQNDPEELFEQPINYLQFGLENTVLQHTEEHESRVARE